MRTLLLASLLGLAACTSMRARIEVSDYTPCDQLLADYVQISGDPAYKAESPGAREIYETKVASCYLEKRRPEKAMELSKGWTDEIFKNRVAARAHAELGQEAECRAALEALDRKSGAPPDFFTSWPEFRPYSASEWFIALAIDSWARVQSPGIETFMDSLVRRGGSGLLPLKVAAADVQRAPGNWAVWTGIVRSGTIDRDAGETVLVAEGVDVRGPSS